MSNGNLRDQFQSVRKGAGKPSAAAATTNVANFSDWLFYGQGDSVFVSVTITPASSSIALTYAVVVLQTPQGLVISQGAFSTSNSQGGFSVNLATGSDTYPVGQYGTSVQAWAFAQAYGVGESYSAIQNYTVQT